MDLTPYTEGSHLSSAVLAYFESVPAVPVHGTSCHGGKFIDSKERYFADCLHFALLLPWTGTSSNDGPRIAGAAALAVKKVNDDRTLLPGRKLEFRWADSGCSAKQGLKAMGKLLQGESRIDAVIGPGCSSACEVTGYLSGGQGIPQISYSCTSPTLSNKNEYGLVHCRNN